MNPTMAPLGLLSSSGHHRLRSREMTTWRQFSSV